MITEVLEFKSWSILERYWNISYKPYGWRVRSGIEHVWSWRRFCMVYRMVGEHDDYQTFEEVVDNKSDVNTWQVQWSCQDLNGNWYKKKFWMPESDATSGLDRVAFHKWACEVEARTPKTVQHGR